jgi:D-glycero-alpha-D-manno-heptose-7-phosphate kinase
MLSSRETVTARTWCRVDLAGGTLDIWPLGLLHPGACTVSVAIDLAATVRAAPRGEGWVVRAAGFELSAASVEELRADPRTALVGTIAAAVALPPCELEIDTASPPGAGLGGSSALGCAVVIAGLQLRGASASAEQIVACVRDVEAQLMGLPTGCQDHWTAVLGGALVLEHRPGGVVVQPLATDLARLGAALAVVYTGQSHVSAAQNWAVVRRRLDGEEDTVARFAAIARVAAAMRDALAAADLLAAGALLSAEWEARRGLAPGLETAAIAATLAAGRQAGAWGGKPCGAAGGGCVALLGPAGFADRLEGLLPTGCRLLPAQPVPGAWQGPLEPRAML